MHIAASRAAASTAATPPENGRPPRAAATARTNEDAGSVLILALVFLVVASLVVTALVGWVGNDLQNSTSFGSARSLEYASGGAVQLEIEIIRYSYRSATASPVTCTPGGAASVTLDGEAIAVYCSVVLNAASASTRVVTFDACPSNESPNACTANPFLQAIVTFDDYGSSDVDHCISPSNEATCGTGMTLSSWILQ
jgi:hypothetical protein